MTFNLWTFLLEAFNFLVLAYVLKRLLYRPLREAIDRRREAHERAKTEAEKARDQAQARERELQAQLADLDRRRQEMLHQAHEQALEERQKLLDEAGRAVQQKQEAARTALARERDETLKALGAELVDQAVGLTRRLLTEAADVSLDRQLTGRLAETVEQCPDSEREVLRRDWRAQDAVVLETAGDPDAGAVQRVTSAVAALLGQPVSLTIERQTGLIAGARLRLGGRVWDASLAGQLNAIPHADSRRPEHV